MLVIDEPHWCEANLAPEGDASGVGDIGIDSETLPAELPLDELDHGLYDRGSNAPAALGGQEREVHPSSLGVGISYLVLDETDRGAPLPRQ